MDIKSQNQEYKQMLSQSIDSLMTSGQAQISSLTKQTMLKVQTMLKLNFGENYEQDKFNLLFTLLAEDNISDKDLMQATKEFLKTKRYKNWTIADWYEILNKGCNSLPKELTYYQLINEYKDHQNKYEIIQKGRPNNEINWRLKKEMK